jgi:hypothetical protein
MWEEPGRRESTEERGDLSSVEVGRLDEENKGRDNVRVEADIEKRERIHMEGGELCRSVFARALTATTGALNSDVRHELNECEGDGGLLETA